MGIIIAIGIGFALSMGLLGYLLGYSDGLTKRENNPESPIKLPLFYED